MKSVMNADWAGERCSNTRYADEPTGLTKASKRILAEEDRTDGLQNDF
jgi:hypothetical protein